MASPRHLRSRMEPSFARVFNGEHASRNPAPMVPIVVQRWSVPIECVGLSAMALTPAARASVDTAQRGVRLMPWNASGKSQGAEDGSSQQEGRPLMADLMAGNKAPLTRAFIVCGWACIPVDWVFSPTHDLPDPQRQESLSDSWNPSVSLQQPLTVRQNPGLEKSHGFLLTAGQRQFLFALRLILMGCPPCRARTQLGYVATSWMRSRRWQCAREPRQIAPLVDHQGSGVVEHRRMV